MADLITTGNDKLRSRLFNWKFTQAMIYTEGESPAVCNLIKELSDSVGDSGWFGGYWGSLVEAVVDLLVEEDG